MRLPYWKISGQVGLRISLLFFITWMLHFSAFAQNGIARKDTSKYVRCVKDEMSGQIDIVDVYQMIFKKKEWHRKDSISKCDSVLRCDSLPAKTGKLHTSFLPGAGYTLQTKFAAGMAANGAFYVDNSPTANLSVVNVYFTYTQMHQIILPVQSNIWTKRNKLNLLGDWRYYRYPQQTFGLGGHTTATQADNMTYSYFTFHQIVAKHVLVDALYVGIGYNLDLHWGITDQVNYPDGTLTDFQKYTAVTGYSQTSTFSAGPSLNILYDDRRNSIYPLKGNYANIVFRQNLTWLGSDQNWQSLLIDVRKYFKVPGYKNSVVAFWSYAWLTMGGAPPYLDLPSTAWDTYSNIGRGYIQSRFRGPGLLYLEGEYRFVLTENGLLGGVLFANAQSVSEWPGVKSLSGFPQMKFEVIQPGVGLGLRIKVNKHSNTNFAFDYAFGLDGSNGIFINLGEVF